MTERVKHFIRQKIEADNASDKYGGQVVTRFPPEPWGRYCESCHGLKQKTDAWSSHGATPMIQVDGNWDFDSWTVDPSLPKTSSGLTISVPAPSKVKDVVFPPIHDTVPVPVAAAFSKPNQASAGTWVK